MGLSLKKPGIRHLEGREAEKVVRGGEQGSNFSLNAQPGGISSFRKAGKEPGVLDGIEERSGKGLEGELEQVWIFNICGHTNTG